MNILIVESETPEVIKSAGFSLADAYGRELQKLRADLVYRVAEPYVAGISALDLSDVDGVIFPGAGVKWSADAPEGKPVARAMQQIFDAGLPCFGSCNGMQLAAVLLGGAVTSGTPEVGIAREVALTGAGRGHPMMQGRADVFSAPTVHGDQVSALPPEAVHLASNAHTRYQAFAYQHGGVDFWGVEYHPEIAPADIGRYIDANREKFPDHLALVDDLERAEFDPDAAQRLGTSVEEMAFAVRALELGNWLGHVAGVGSE